LIAAESMIVSLLSMVKQRATGLFKVRPSLCQLNNLRHGLALARIDADAAPAAWQLAADVAQLRESWFTSPERDRTDRAKTLAARATPALREALWALGERSGPGEDDPGELRLGSPWSNVTLVPGDAERAQVAGTERLRLPSLRSARIAEVRWRAARPRVGLHPNVIALLTGADGRQEISEFRSARRELVRGYHEFLAEAGGGYAEIGLASAFSPGAATRERRT
jgi:hypothetical protein